MPSTYTDFYREPSIPHQCMHTDEDTGRHCRARAMHNNFMCFAHRDKAIPPVIENEPFEITHLANRAAIQRALAGVASRLACNRIDLKRAGLIVYTLQVASCNLNAPPLPETADSDAGTTAHSAAVSPDPALSDSLSESPASQSPKDPLDPAVSAALDAAREEFRALTLQHSAETAALRSGCHTANPSTEQVTTSYYPRTHTCD